MASQTQTIQKIPGPSLARRYNKTARTVSRWLNDPKLNFPKPLVINGRNYWDVDEIELWERQQASASRGKTSKSEAA